MVAIKIKCPYCNSDDISKRGCTKNGKQRYCCNNDECKTNTFIIDYTYKAWSIAVKSQIIPMAMNGSGIRDISRVLGISTMTVLNELKKKENIISNINLKLLNEIADLNSVEVDVILVEESELDEMWSYVGNKKNRHWLWHAIDHKTGKVLAYTFGTQEDKVFVKLKEMLTPFGIKTYYTDGNPTYARKIEAEKHIVGKKNTQKIERKHLNLRTRIKRLARKTICFSKSVIMHEIVIGLFINIMEFGLLI